MNSFHCMHFWPFAPVLPSLQAGQNWEPWMCFSCFLHGPLSPALGQKQAVWVEAEKKDRRGEGGNGSVCVCAHFPSVARRQSGTQSSTWHYLTQTRAHIHTHRCTHAYKQYTRHTSMHRQLQVLYERVTGRILLSGKERERESGCTPTTERTWKILTCFPSYNKYLSSKKQGPTSISVCWYYWPICRYWCLCSAVSAVIKRLEKMRGLII